MGNRNRSRELRRQWEWEEAWRQARTEPRPLTDDVRIPGIGSRRLQLVYLPPFSPGRSWDVRQPHGTWTLYASTVQTRGRDWNLVGYTPLEMGPERLAAFVRRAMALSMPVAPLLNGMAGLDGEIFQLALFGDLHSEVRFQWWSDPPPQWAPMVSLAAEMIEAFAACPERPDPPRD